MRKFKPRPRVGGDVVVGDFHSFDDALVTHIQSTLWAVRESRRRRWFSPKPTRGRRRREGRAREKRKQRMMHEEDLRGV